MPARNRLPFSPARSPAIAAALNRIDAARAAIDALAIPAAEMEKALHYSNIIPILVNPSVKIAPIAQRTDMLSVPLDLMADLGRPELAASSSALMPQAAEQVLADAGYSPFRKLSYEEVKAYEAALAYVKKSAAKKMPLSQEVLQTIHGLLMAEGYRKPGPSDYRYDQNTYWITADNGTEYTYLTPPAEWLPELVEHMLEGARREDIHCALRACLAMYHLLHLHPFDAGNGRTSRMLATMILYQGGYGFNNTISAEYLFAENLDAYYLSFRHGRKDSYSKALKRDATPWLEFCASAMAGWYEKMLRNARNYSLQR
jgi:fido (protein-threonine AMPylation protein)